MLQRFQVECIKGDKRHYAMVKDRDEAERIAQEQAELRVWDQVCVAPVEVSNATR